jgi:hypothetical protein
LNIYFLQKKKSRKNKISVVEMNFEKGLAGINWGQALAQGFFRWP